MVSPTSLVLAGTLLLLLCLLVFLGRLLLRARQLHAFGAIDLERLQNKYTILEEKLAAYPKKWTSNSQDTGFSKDDVDFSLAVFSCALAHYCDRWICSDLSPKKESVTRIEGVLFAEPRRRFGDRDMRIFPNPHQYTPAEICTFLERRETRESIVLHIMCSILLHAISLEGNPLESLLPLASDDMDALASLKTMVRGRKLSANVHAHISKFGLYYALEYDSKPPFIELFDSIFGPYITFKSPEDVYKHRLQLIGVLDAATEYGMKVIGMADLHIDYRWGARDENNAIMTNPPVDLLEYKNDKLLWRLEVAKSIMHSTNWRAPAVDSRK